MRESFEKSAMQFAERDPSIRVSCVPDEIEMLEIRRQIARDRIAHERHDFHGQSLSNDRVVQTDAVTVVAWDPQHHPAVGSARRAHLPQVRAIHAMHVMRVDARALQCLDDGGRADLRHLIDDCRQPRAPSFPRFTIQRAMRVSGGPMSGVRRMRCVACAMRLRFDSDGRMASVTVRR